MATRCCVCEVVNKEAAHGEGEGTKRVDINKGVKQKVT